MRPRTLWLILAIVFFALFAVLISILPVGAMQAWASVAHGLWDVRTAEFMHRPLVHLFVRLRVPGDVVFSLGPVLPLWFAAKLVREARGRRAHAAPAPVPAE
jgi:nitric oxide reductase subunit B